MRLAIETKIKHGIIYAYMLKHGLTQAALAKKIGVGAPTLSKYLNLRAYPNKKRASSATSLKKLCKFFRCSERQLFPKRLKEHFDHKTEIARVLQETRVTFLPEAAIEYIPDYNALAPELIAYDPQDGEIDSLVDIEMALKKLEKRQPGDWKRKVEIFRKRYGVFGEEPHTLAELGAHYGVTKERVRQVVLNVERRLRYLIHSKDKNRG